MDKPLPPKNGLPSAFLVRFRAALEELGCRQTPIALLANCLVTTSKLHGFPDQDAMGNLVLSLAAAHHSTQRFPVTLAPLPCDERESLPTANEWLLFAALERARSGWPNNLTAAVDAAIERSMDLNTVTTGTSTSSDDPFVDYGIGLFLPALTNRPETSIAGRAIGRLTRLLAEIHAILDPKVLAPRPDLLGRIAAEVDLESRFSVALALACKPVPDKLPLVCLFGSERVASRVIEMSKTWANDISTVMLDAEGLPLRELAETLTATIANKVAGARFFGLLPPPPTMMSEVERTISLARKALEFDPELRAAWEVQRWGAWCDKPRVGRVFPVGLCLLALSRVDGDLSGRVAEMLLRSCRVDGWRYYDDWVGIPPDSDDLGLVLRLAARVTPGLIDPGVFVRPLDLVQRTMGPDGAIAVWLDDGLDEPVPEDGPHWLGPRCIAVAAQLLLGVTEAGINGTMEMRSRGVDWIVQSWHSHRERAVYHYTWPFARLLIAKLANALASIPGGFAQNVSLRAVVAEIEDSIRESRNADGGWQTPLATACHLTVLSLGDRPFDPWPSITYLASRQGPDGMWPAEPLYRCPGKDGVSTAHGAAAITTAVCLDALLDVRDWLNRHL